MQLSQRYQATQLKDKCKFHTWEKTIDRLLCDKTINGIDDCALDGNELSLKYPTMLKCEVQEKSTSSAGEVPRKSPKVRNYYFEIECD